MNIEEQNTIKDAVSEALFLLNEELESVINDDLAERYEAVLEKLQRSLSLLEN